MAQGRIRRLVTRILKWVWVPVVAFVLVVAMAMACAVWSPEGRVYGVNKMGYVSSNPAHSERVPTALYQR